MDTQNHQNSPWIRRKIIGKGSYGTVSLGIRQSDGQCFAVKSADKDSLSSIQALENEIQILRSLSPSSSPFIVEYYGDDETKYHRNLYLEYVSGGDVAMASSGGIADVELIRSYAWCLVMALRTLHSHRIVHCDIKGSNVLLAADAGVAKLADFGSAKRIDQEDDERDGRAKIVPRGSPLWMAPEVVRGESQGLESDVWSLGCTVIEMFTGVPAWQDCGAHTLYKIGYSNDLPEYPARVPEVGRDFLDKCLNRDPRRRWSCDQLLRHPFLLPALATKIAESSPRSVLDLDFSDYDDDDHESDVEESDQASARERIGKLATISGVNWESDGWVEVRTLRREKREDDEEQCETGTSSEYSNLEEEGIQVISPEQYDRDCPTLINSAGRGDVDERESGGDRCGDGGAACGI
ncbi:hypothetical protein Cgig2_015956 [Carnegiea gigantea]|uniref:Protein kinase domain-containing protein n=1 Tax=Carnegiea gigantea TaxID=171969 RepID=A0A9Q1KNH1_9CARY|nr:hypothetical protein Cgig2_015956 [Carnegiea gigantea]